jgi:hypothetical protein
MLYCDVRGPFFTLSPLYVRQWRLFEFASWGIHRPRLKKLLYIWSFLEVPTKFKPLQNPGGGFTSENAERRF